MTLLDSFKTIIIFAIILYFAPSVIENIKKQYLFLLEPQTHIGVIYITKPLHNAHSIITQLHEFFQNPAIKGIVIKINSQEIAPGTSQTIFHDIRQLKKEYPKPIISLIENICLGGSYLIASACDYIIAPESAIIGNIGSSFSNLIMQEIPEGENYSLDILKNEAYQQLIKQIALTRKLSLTTIQNWANGKIFTATQAITLGLINEIGSLCTVIKIIKEKIPLEGDIEWIEHHEKTPLLNIFFGNERAITQ